jgi:hypothetical protein
MPFVTSSNNFCCRRAFFCCCCWRLVVAPQPPRLAGVLCPGLGGLWLMSLPVVVQWGAGPGASRRWPVRTGRPGPAGRCHRGAGLRARARRSGLGRGSADWRGPGAQRYAARLAKASGLPVLTSGGLHYGTPPTEAQLMADRCTMISASRCAGGRAQPHHLGKRANSAPRFCCRGHQARGGGHPGLAHAAFGVEF